ncbi:TRAP transporter permease [Hwanghaeella grinnelliae]|uniref:TRAP transporter permease n=1 Tax=Hwanghaeella grinnelliae TaxID=2500179 RepID=A0A437QUZ8_9PROT|nr:TRAP transporter permease [Hwanghaeella grinnelliae]RVU38318.1 TRAP transporter permease [Hwanghaeella grinnelliae]
MTDTTSTAPEADAEALNYDEVREYSVLETALMRRGFDVIKWLAVVVSTIAISLALFHLFIALFGTPESRAFRSTHLTGMMVLAVLLYPLGREKWSVRPTTSLQWGLFALDLLMVLAILGVQVYTLYDLDAFNQREGALITSDLWVGALLIALVMETTRRAVGIPMVLVTLFFVAHTLYANYFFGFLYGPPTSFKKYMDIVFIRSEGIFGIPISVAATYIVLFIIFGAVLIRTGAGRMFIDLAIALTGHRTGGPAKASVVASAFLGTVSGSAVANVVTTGSFTIPLMKKLGYRSKFAGAVEACASSGGQITPPIMGAAAFIIAEFMRVSYFTVIIAAIIPTLLYFATIYFMVDIEAEKDGIKRLDRRTLPKVWHVLKHGWHQLLTLGVLLALLGMGYSPMMSAFWAIVALVALSFRDPLTRLSPVDLLAALESGVRAAMPVTVACGCAGIIIGSIFVSGLGLKFTNEVIGIADGNLFILLTLTGIAAIILGMGMTTTAVYITVAALIVPSLIQMDVAPMAAHMFAFYFGVVSTITPPVALASFAAAAIAGSRPMETAVESARIGIAKYLVPFAFVYNPALLFEGPVWLTILSGILAFISLWGLSVVLEGWFRGRVPPITRAILTVLSLMALMPPLEDVIPGVPGFILPVLGAAGIVFFTYTRQRSMPETAR